MNNFTLASNWASVQNVNHIHAEDGVDSVIITMPNWVKWFVQVTAPIESIEIPSKFEQHMWFANLHGKAVALKNELLKNIQNEEEQPFSFTDDFNAPSTTLSDFLLEICRYRYKNASNPIEAYSKEIIPRCDYHLQTLRDIAEVCGMIPSVEHQLRFFERQAQNYSTKNGKVKSVNRFDSYYWKHKFEDGFFDRLQNEVLQYTQLNVKLLKKDQVKAQLMDLVNYCQGLPIASMILPCILTLHCIKPNAEPSIYPRLKSLRDYRSDAARNSALSLHYKLQLFIKQEIADVMQISDTNLTCCDYKNHVAFEPCIPKFDWAQIVNTFCSAHNVSSKAEIDFIWACLIVAQKNSRLPANWKEILETKSYGRPLQDLIKLCNYNTYLLIRAGFKLTGKRLAALKNLKENKVIPAANMSYVADNKASSWEIYSEYFYPYLKDEHSVSGFMLFRYCHLPISIKFFEYMPYGVFELQSDYYLAAEVFIRDMCEDFKNEQLQKQRFWGRPHTTKAMREAKQLSFEICNSFTQKEFEMFASSPSNFQEAKFQKFLFDFCNRNQITYSTTLLEEEQAYVEFSAYETMLELSNIYLCNEVMECWQLLVSRLLYREQPRHDDYANLEEISND